MSSLSIKDVPEAWAETLRQRAARNHRSLQGELMAIIETAVKETDAAGFRPPARRGSKTIEQIATERRAMFPQPILGGPLAVDIIREERDAR
ncbi:MAG: Arc family DNA-binding protein [Comamonadaceae bacterium]|nr:MAG: Arc family DNA-binding protein [Comamonadaceae bacterium]